METFVKLLPCTQREKNHTVDFSQINEAKQSYRELPFKFWKTAKFLSLVSFVNKQVWIKTSLPARSWVFQILPAGSWIFRNIFEILLASSGKSKTCGQDLELSKSCQQDLEFSKSHRQVLEFSKSQLAARSGILQILQAFFWNLL